MRDIEDGIARWRRVADDLRAAIAGGTLVGQLPPEGRLAASYGVNRHTVRRALAVLAAAGLVGAELGRGTFVEAATPRLAYPMGARTRFSENVQTQSRQPGGRLIAADRVRADAELAMALGCAAGTPLHRLEALRVADGVPLSLGTVWLEAARFPDIVRHYAESGSMTEALKAEGIADYRRQETRVTAERLSPADAEHLGSAPGGLALVARAVNVDRDGRPFQVQRTRFHADRMELVFRHGDEGSPSPAGREKVPERSEGG